MTIIYFIAGVAIIPLIIWGIVGQGKVRRLFGKYSQEPTKKGVTGSRLARRMLNDAGLTGVVIEEVRSDFSDHYDPRQKIVKLSRNVARSSSITAVGIAAHESAHAIQDGAGFTPFKLRNSVAPIAETATSLVLPLFVLGILISGAIASTLFVNVALILFLVIAAFYVATLSVEIEASSRAMKYIKSNEIADEEELQGIRKVLRAAALTYVIAAAVAVAQFIRLMGGRK